MLMEMKSWVAVAATTLTFAAHATAYTWTGGADDGGKWSTPANWGVESGYPGSEGTADTATFNAGTAEVEIDVTGRINSITVKDGSQVSLSGTGKITSASSIVGTKTESGAVLSVTGDCLGGGYVMPKGATVSFKDLTAPLNATTYFLYPNVAANTMTFENCKFSSLYRPLVSNFNGNNYNFIDCELTLGGNNEIDTSSVVLIKNSSIEFKGINNTKFGGSFTIEDSFVSIGPASTGIKRFTISGVNSQVLYNNDSTLRKKATITFPAEGFRRYAPIGCLKSLTLDPEYFQLVIDASALPAKKGLYRVIGALAKLNYDDAILENATIVAPEGAMAKLVKGYEDPAEATISLSISTVEQAENTWTVEPELSKTTWWMGEAGDLTTNAYAAAYGTVTCNYTLEELAALPAGKYTVTFAVAETETVTGLVKSIPVSIMGEDTQAATYTWKSDVIEGNWCDPDNWTTDVGTQGYPSNALVKAIIPTGTQSRTIDLEGCAIPLKASTDPGLTVSGAGATIRNGSVSIGRLWGGENCNVTYEDMTIDLNSSVNTAYFSLQKLATVILRGTVSITNGWFNAAGYNDDVTICDGTTYVEGHVTFGNDQTAVNYQATKGTLTVTNATLVVNQNFNFGTTGREDHKTPVLQMFDGNIACTNTYKKSGVYQYGTVQMRSPARVELMLSPADKAIPRIAANYANLSNMTFVVKSAEAGRYPLVSATTSLALPNDSLEGLSLDVSALGQGYTGTLQLRDDGKTLAAKIIRDGLIIFLR